MYNNNKNTQNSTAINLANLKAQFQADLTSYKQAVADYTAVLEKESKESIPYMLIGVGTNGFLYVKQSLDESDTWALVNDNSNGKVRSVCTGIDGKTIYGTSSDNDMIYKTSWDAPTWMFHSSYGKGKFQGVAACPDGTLLGVGMDNVLYQIRSDGSYTNVKTSVNDGESEISVAIGPDGSVFVAGTGTKEVYKKNSYQNLSSQSWQGQNSCCITAMTIASDGTFIGVGMDSFLYSKDNYTDLTTPWKGPYTSSCCVVSVTTVLKPKPSSYILVGVGSMDGNLWSSQGLGKPWLPVTADDANGSLRSVCTGIDGHTLYCTNSNNQIYYKSSWDYHTWTLLNTGGGLFKGVAACPDGTLLGVGLDNKLYQIRTDGSYTPVNTSESEIGVAVGLDGSVFVCNGGGDVYKKNSYQNLQNQQWQYLSGGCCISAMTIAPDGTFIGVGAGGHDTSVSGGGNNYLYSKDSYTDLTTPWKGPHSSSCCIAGITTVSIPLPTQMVSTRSQTYWGKGQAGSQNVYTNVTTVEDCAALCSTTTGCSGATFNPIDHGQPMCWLRSGDSDIGPGLYNDYSIVPETKKYLEIMKSINSKLNDGNQQIMALTTGEQGEYDEISNRSSNNQIELIKNYKALQYEKKKIDELLKNFDDLTESQVDTELSTNQNYYSFILLSVITIAIGFLLYLCSSPNFTLDSILQTIQHGGTNIARFLFYTVILIIIVISFIKLRNKFN